MQQCNLLHDDMLYVHNDIFLTDITGFTPKMKSGIHHWSEFIVINIKNVLIITTGP